MRPKERSSSVRANVGLFWLLGVFFGLMTVVYGVWFYLEDPSTFALVGGRDTVGFWAGVIPMGLSGVLAGFIAFYLGLAHKAQGAELPEDILTAEIDDADPELGHYSPWSWWPIVLGATIAAVLLGVGIGPWLSLFALPFFLVALVGWVFEYYRGYFSH